MRQNGQSGFTLMEMITVIVITGILGSMAAVFIKLPVQQYTDVARRADLAGIMDLALFRLESDIRSALPHSARASSVACTGGTCSFLEILPSSGSGRYLAVSSITHPDNLDFTVADSSFEVLGAMPAISSVDQIIVMDSTYAAYAGNNRASGVSVAGSVITISPFQFPVQSPDKRFYVINQAVSYVCDPVGTLTRYSYPIQATQPTTSAVLASGRLLANNVSSCSFNVTDNNGAVGNSLVGISLGVSKDGESATLYKVVHVGNGP